jgi:type IV secretion system protein VirD4
MKHLELDKLTSVGQYNQYADVDDVLLILYDQYLFVLNLDEYRLYHSTNCNELESVIAQEKERVNPNSHLKVDRPEYNPKHKLPYLINAQYQTRCRKFNLNTNYAPDSHGGAKWQQHHELMNNKIVCEEGIPLGISSDYWCPTSSRDSDSRDYFAETTKLVRYSGKKHLVTVAPSGTGKGTAVQIPVLLEHDASMFMIDPKGENAIVTADYRKKTLKQDVFIVNPFGVLDAEFKEQGLECHGFNPLNGLNHEDTHFVADVAALSEALIVTEGNDPYWSNSARELISCLIMNICINEKVPKNRNLKEMRVRLARPEVELLAHLIAIAKNTNNPKPLRQKASLFTNSSKGTASIISTAISQTSFLDDPCISDNLCLNDFGFNQLKDKPTTVFLILPARFMVAYSKWFRILITSALDTLMSTHKQPKKPVLFMLDECATIGYLPCIETAVGLARGYGIQIWSFFQDIHQLKDIYGARAESFLANAGVQQYFTPNDAEMAERISKRIGNTTIRATSWSNSNGQSIGYGTANTQSGHANSTTEIGVPLIQPADVLGMDKRGQILFIEVDSNKDTNTNNANPIYAAKNNYYENLIYRNRYRSNPYWNE